MGSAGNDGLIRVRRTTPQRLGASGEPGNRGHPARLDPGFARTTRTSSSRLRRMIAGARRIPGQSSPSLRTLTRSSTGASTAPGATPEPPFMERRLQLPIPFRSRPPSLLTRLAMPHQPPRPVTAHTCLRLPSTGRPPVILLEIRVRTP